MKKIILLIIIFTVVSCCAQPQKDLEVNVRKAWKTLDDASADAELYGGKLVLAGTLEFVKRTTEPIFITKILLKWNGKKLQSLTGSLYKQPIDKEFFPLEEFWLCDGSWNIQDQHLVLTLDRPLSLEAKTMIHVVFTLPPSLESSIGNGFFEIEPFSRAKSFHELVPAAPFKLVCAKP